MNASTTRWLVILMGMLCILLAACAGPASAQTHLTDVEIRRDPASGEEHVEIRMGEVHRDEIGELIARIAGGEQEVVREVEVVHVYAPEGGDVTRTEERIHLQMEDGRQLRMHREIRTRGGPAGIPDGANVAKAARLAIERALSRPPVFAPKITNQDLKRVELQVEREPTAVAEHAGYRSSWFGNGA